VAVIHDADERRDETVLRIYGGNMRWDEKRNPDEG
jgi:hypothetical protein